jgi:hypothetical protein
MPLKLAKPRILFILMPAVAAIWPLWLAFVALPGARMGWDSDKEKISAARATIWNIFELDPDRLQNLDPTGKLEKFEYPVVVNKIALASGISPTAYKVNVLANVRPSSGQASQNAMVSISGVSVKTAAEFVSLGEMRYYPNLKCTQLSLKKIRDKKDLWEVDLTFTHYE